MKKPRMRSVTIRLSEAEYQWILKNDTGGNVSQFIRRRLFSYNSDVRTSAEATLWRIKTKLADANQEFSRLQQLMRFSGE